MSVKEGERLARFLIYFSSAKNLTRCINFDVFLTVHLGIFVLVINQLDAQNFCFTVGLFHASTCTRRPLTGVMIPEAV